MGLSCKPNIYVSWSTSELRVRLAPWNRFKPSSTALERSVKIYFKHIVLQLNSYWYYYSIYCWAYNLNIWSYNSILSVFDNSNVWSNYTWLSFCIISRDFFRRSLVVEENMVLHIHSRPFQSVSIFPSDLVIGLFVLYKLWIQNV